MKRRCLKLMLILSLGGLTACWRLPSDFASMPLDQKVQAYEHRFKLGGARSLEADDLIVRHGYSAAQAMVPYVRGEREGIPPFVAINIIWDVQIGGCNLRRSAAEDALRYLLSRGNPQADERLAAEIALRWIDENRHSTVASVQLPPAVCKPPA